MENEQRLRELFTYEDVRFAYTRLSSIASEARCVCTVRDEKLGLAESLDRRGPPVDLIVLPLPSEPSAVLAALRVARERAWVSAIPVLGVSRIDRSDLDLWQLRALGVVGLIDDRALPEHVRFRITQVLYAGHEGRRHERAPCSLSVRVDGCGAVSQERAIALSEGGIGLSSSRRLEPNAHVKLRLRLDSDPGELLELESRVVHARPVQRREVRYEIGLFFLDPSERARAAIREEVRFLLEAVRREWIEPSAGPAAHGATDAREGAAERQDGRAGG
jgi:hypothetical protein